MFTPPVSVCTHLSFSRPANTIGARMPLVDAAPGTPTSTTSRAVNWTWRFTTPVPRQYSVQSLSWIRRARAQSCSAVDTPRRHGICCATVDCAAGRRLTYSMRVGGGAYQGRRQGREVCVGKWKVRREGACRLCKCELDLDLDLDPGLAWLGAEMLLRHLVVIVAVSGTRSGAPTDRISDLACVRASLPRD